MIPLSADIYVNPKHVTHIRQDGPNVTVSLVSGKWISVRGTTAEVAEKLDAQG